MDPSLIPPDAWAVLLKSGNAGLIVLAVLFWRNYERTGKLALDLAVLKAKLGVKENESDTDKSA